MLQEFKTPRCDAFRSDLPLVDLEWVFVTETDRV